jgi:3-oxosteroid 1-dehydrogenase
MTAAGEFDVVVVGSGGAGLTAALTAAHQDLTVVVIEKEATFGGSTARSGGGLWVPGNEVLRRAGVADTGEQARAYLAHVVAGRAADARQEALLEHGPAMLDLVRRHTPLEFTWVPGYADYYPEAPGGLPAGRSIEPVPLDGRVLGPELATLGPPYLPAPPGVIITQRDYRWLSLGPRHPRAVLTGAKVAGRAARARLLRQRPLSMGQALAAGLRAGLRDRDVPVWLSTPMTGLCVQDGRVTGVEVTRDGQPAVITARRGVLLAAGGFERNAEMREEYQRGPVDVAWTTGAAGNTGDGIRAAACPAACWSTPPGSGTSTSARPTSTPCTRCTRPTPAPARPSPPG